MRVQFDVIAFFAAMKGHRHPTLRRVAGFRPRDAPNEPETMRQVRQARATLGKLITFHQTPFPPLKIIAH
jgi:hypothetical protein